MRILLVTPLVPRRDGAGAIPILLHAELAGLSERHDVTLLTAAGDEPGEAEGAAALRARGDLSVHVVDRRRPPPGPQRVRRQVRLARTWATRRWPWRTVWFAEPEIGRTLTELTAKTSFDVIAVEDSSMSVLPLPAGVPAVLTHHEVLRPRPLEWRAWPPQRWPRHMLGELDWRRWRSFQRQAWERFDRVQVFSGRDAETIASLAPDLAARVRVNPFGIELGAAADPRSEIPGNLLFVGNFTHAPNRDAAIWTAREIFPVVQREHPESRLQILGSGPPAEIRDLAGPNVDVIADPPSVRPHLEAASVVLAPVRTGGGMRMKVLEALAAAKAVVTTPRGAEGFTVFEADPPFEVAESAPAFAAAVSGLLADSTRRRSLGDRARRFAEHHHSPLAWAKRLEAVYEEARREHARG